MNDQITIGKVRQLLDDYTVNSRFIASAEVVDCFREAIESNVKAGNLLTQDLYNDIRIRKFGTVVIRILALKEDGEHLQTQCMFELNDFKDVNFPADDLLEEMISRHVAMVESMCEGNEILDEVFA
jgi:hypothetical protein